MAHSIVALRRARRPHWSKVGCAKNAIDRRQAGRIDARGRLRGHSPAADPAPPSLPARCRCPDHGRRFQASPSRICHFARKSNATLQPRGQRSWRLGFRVSRACHQGVKLRCRLKAAPWYHHPLAMLCFAYRRSRSARTIDLASAHDYLLPVFEARRQRVLGQQAGADFKH